MEAYSDATIHALSRNRAPQRASRVLSRDSWDRSIEARPDESVAARAMLFRPAAKVRAHNKELSHLTLHRKSGTEQTVVRSKERWRDIVIKEN
jgi:hypothetical protein